MLHIQTKNQNDSYDGNMYNKPSDCYNKSENELILHLALGRITFLKFNEKNILAKKLDSPHSLVLLSIEEISNIVGRNISSRVNWDSKENLRNAELCLHYCKTLGIHVVLNSDDYYPDLLRQIEDPPYLLFCRGNLGALKNVGEITENGENCFYKKSVSVVGTRRLTPFGKSSAKSFAYDAALDGCTVISGLANGADGYAHEGVIDAYYDTVEKGGNVNSVGKTIAVLPCAIDEIVPYGHKRLAGKILETGGCLISEYEPKSPIGKWQFVGRNRIIAGLSPATVVIEAPAGSGALITADFALENGRDVMFHEAGVCEAARKVSDASKRDLEMKCAAGLVSKYKVENTTEKYLDAGAPIIKNYKDYCDCLSEVPGERARTYIQGELFQ